MPKLHKRFHPFLSMGTLSALVPFVLIFVAKFRFAIETRDAPFAFMIMLAALYVWMTKKFQPQQVKQFYIGFYVSTFIIGVGLVMWGRALGRL